MPDLYDDLGFKIPQRHGLTNNPAFGVWRHMIARCYSKRDSMYRYWGARGITVCEEWHDPATFCDWAMESGHAPGLTLDRIDNDGNYEPSNCRWTTIKEQCRNRRSTRWVEVGGVRMTLTEASDHFGISRNVVRNRVFRGWPIDRALAQPLDPRNVCRS